MPMLLNDSDLERRIIAKRRARGIDKFDEVWDGVYVMAPIANNEHQEIQGSLVTVLGILLALPGLAKVLAGVNVSDRPVDWKKNFRCPDVAVFLRDTLAENRKTHWFGGPDFAVEIVSRRDRSRKKMKFYAAVGTRELLIIDREPWQIELFRLIDGKLVSVFVGTVENAVTAKSQVVPISLQLLPGNPRPGILVKASDGQSWTI